jgi:hypothetical protein
VTAVHLKNESYVNDDIVKATSMELVNTMKDLLNMNPLYGEQFKTLMSLTGANTSSSRRFPTMAWTVWCVVLSILLHLSLPKYTLASLPTLAVSLVGCFVTGLSLCVVILSSCPAGSIDLGDLSRLVDAAASLTSADDVTLQDILETLDVPERWEGVAGGDCAAA